MEIKEVLDVFESKIKEFKSGTSEEMEKATKAFNDKLEGLANELKQKGATIDEINETLKEVQAKAARMFQPKTETKSFADALGEALTEKK